MADEIYQTVRFLDVKIKQNYSPTSDSKPTETQLRVPIFSVMQGIGILDLVFNVEPKNIVEITVYRISKIYGNHRYDYRIVREYLPEETAVIISNYLKYNRKKYIK